MASERPEAESRAEPELDSAGETSAKPSSTPPAGAAQPGGDEETGRHASIPPASERPSEPPADGREPRRGRFENILPGLIRRGIEKGIEAGMHTFERSLETGRGTTDAVRGVLSEVKLPRDVANAVGRALTEAKLPRELAGAIFSQLDETKNDVLRIVAGEVRDFLEATDIASELKAALTSLSFEIRTEVRFIPNEAGTGVRADVRARSRVKHDRDERRSDRQRRRDARKAAKPTSAEKAKEEQKEEP
jgi:hypothetical protein